MSGGGLFEGRGDPRGRPMGMSVGRRMAVLALVGAWICGFAVAVRAAEASVARPRDYRFDGSISRAVLENYLSRSITMEGLLNGRGDLGDNARMLKETGAKFVGRALCLWGGE